MSATVEIVDNYDSNQLSEAGEDMLATLSPELRQIAYQIRMVAAETQEWAQCAIERALKAGELLMQLQEGLGHGHGGDRKSANFKAPRGTLTLFTLADLASELGVPRRTAFRWMSLAKANQLAQRIEAFEVVELPPTGGAKEPRKVGGTKEQADIARDWREKLIAGETPITRAQPALMGALATKKTGRAPVNDGNNIAVAIAKLKNSLPALTELPPLEYNKLEEMWLRDVLPRLPERWLSSKGAQ